MSDPTIKQLLAEQGITVLSRTDSGPRELVRDGKSLGFFQAGAAVSAFLTPTIAQPQIGGAA